jgi:iron complex outermembrane receptor protein/vitamin B12 transporter
VERGNFSYTFELQGDIHNRLFYTLGGGLEDNGLFGFAATPRASLAWQVAATTKLRASFGKGIKEPAIFDQLESLYALLSLAGSQPEGNQLIAQDHIAPIGPPNSRTYDGGIDQSLFGGRSRVSLSLFHNEFTHGIEYIPPQGLTLLGVPSDIVTIAENTNYGATVNTKDYRAQGIETELESQLTHHFFARAGYTYVDAKIQHSFTGDAIDIGVFSPLIGARTVRISPHSGYFQTGYRHAKLLAALSGTLVSRRDDSDFLEYDANGGLSMLLPNRNLDGAYQKMDLTTSYQAMSRVAVEGSFQNLLSEHYSEAFGYPSLPFTFRLGLKFTVGGELWAGK